ncbi:MAG: hypothetical protein ACERKO_13020, partial [Acetanaerobacterium sp.]
MKKSRFLVLLFSLIPGAGEMYLGMMKTGVMIMSLFCGIIVLGNWLRFEFIFFALPVLWFYSFFNVHNQKHLAPEWLKQQDDRLFSGTNGFLEGRLKSVFEKRHKIIGVACIAIGAYALFDNTVSPYLYQLEDIIPPLYALLRNLPTLIVSLA